MKKFTLFGLVLLAVYSINNLAFAYGALSLSQTNVSLNVGQSTAITAYPPSGQIVNMSSIGNTFVAYANISGNTITIYALGNGSTNITFCTFDNTCAIVYVTVVGTGGSIGQISFSQNNISLNAGQTASVSAYSTTGSSMYISNNSNAQAVSSYITGNTVNLYASSPGSSTITVCAQNSNQCATLNVTVNQTGLGNLYFTTTSLNQPVVNQYYSYQLNVRGGATPYNFTINSGALPSGLFLSSSGLIYGTPPNSNTNTFMIRATDYYGRSAISQLFTLTPSGSVLGTTIYNNGTLINDNGTIYITYKNTKSGFSNYNAFTSLGYKLSNVIVASTAALNNTGFIISTPNMAHPWGSWVKSGSTIYFVHENGLIPISSFDIFVNNGGVLQNVVEANSYDFSKAMLPLMTYNDQRLK